MNGTGPKTLFENTLDRVVVKLRNIMNSSADEQCAYRSINMIMESSDISTKNLQSLKQRLSDVKQELKSKGYKQYTSQISEYIAEIGTLIIKRD